MKKLFLGSFLSLISLSSMADEKCGQMPSLLKVRSSISSAASLITPINDAIIDSEGYVKSEIQDDLGRSDFTSEEMTTAIDELDTGKVSLQGLGSDVGQLVKESISGCVSSEKLLALIDELEKVKFASAYYRNFLASAQKELTTQTEAEEIVKADLVIMLNGDLSEETEISLRRRYMGNNISIAISHAQESLAEVQKNTSTLKKIDAALKADDINKTFKDLNEKMTSAVDEVYKAIELAVE